MKTMKTVSRNWKIRGRINDAKVHIAMDILSDEYNQNRKEEQQ